MPTIQTVRRPFWVITGVYATPRAASHCSMFVTGVNLPRGRLPVPDIPDGLVVVKEPPGDADPDHQADGPGP